MHKKTITFLLSITLTASIFAGCGKGQTSSPKTESQKTESASSESVRDVSEDSKGKSGNKDSREYKLAGEFADALAAEDFDSVLGMTDIPEGSFITGSDIGYYLKTHGYGDIIGGEVQVDSCENMYKYYKATLSANGQSASATILYNKDGDPYIEMRGLYYQGKLKCAAADITVNGIPLDRSKAVVDTSENTGKVLYDVCVPASIQDGMTIPATVTSDAFGTEEGELYYNEDWQCLGIRSEVSPETAQEAMNAFADIYNAMLELGRAGADKTEYYQYFSDNAETSFRDNSIEWIMHAEEMSGGASNRNISCRDVKKWNGERIFALTDNRLCMNIQYTTQWDNYAFEEMFGTDNARHLATIYLEKNAEGKYVIYGKTVQSDTFSRSDMLENWANEYT